MKIISIDATNHKIPVIDPVTDRTTNSRITFIRVETDEGITGYSSVGGSVTRDFIEKDIGPILIGKNPLFTESIWYNFLRRSRARAKGAIWSNGVGALDIALWDIKGKYFNQPIYVLLGGARQSVPAYITCGSGAPYEQYTPEQIAEFFNISKKEGHDKFKMQVARGRWPWETHTVMTESLDIARVRAVREAVGDEAQLMIDANSQLSLIDALRLIKKLDPFEITWFEEPISLYNVDLWSQLRLKSSMPLAGGANEMIWKHRELVENKAVDIVQPGVQRVGGFTQALKVAHLAQAYNLPIVTAGGLGLHLAAGVDNGWRVECHFAGWSSSSKIWRDFPQPKKGWITVSDKPGLGIKPDEDSLSEFLVDEVTYRLHDQE